jgi:hypothetical protein
MRDITEAYESMKMREPETPRMHPPKREAPKLPSEVGG